MHRRTIILALVTSLLAAPAAALHPPTPIERLAPDGDAFAAMSLALGIAEEIGAVETAHARAARAALQLGAAKDPSAVVAGGLAVWHARGAPAEGEAFAHGAIRALDAIAQLGDARDVDDVLALAQALATLAPNTGSADVPPFARSVDLEHALTRFLDAHAWPSDDATRAQLAPLHALPSDAQEGLAIMLDATTYARAAALAPRALEDHGHLAYARAVTIAAVREAAPLLAHVSGGPNLRLCGLLILDLEGVDDTHAEDCLAALMIDVAGNDLYLNNAGGATNLCALDTGVCPESGLPPAAIALDLAGDDRYEGAPTVTVEVLRGVSSFSRKIAASVNGGGHGGVGHLFDLGGADVYDLRDQPNSYTTFGATGNGGARLGAGLLLDAGDEPDRYVQDAGSNFRTGPHSVASFGASLALDAGGDDSYVVTGTSGYAFGFAFTGTALMLDLGGSDVYQCAHVSSACLGIATHGLAVVADVGAGHDLYATGAGLGVAWLSGVAVVADDGGHNTFDAGYAPAQGVGDGAYDLGATKAYGGALGILIAGEGTDTFTAADPWGHLPDAPRVMSQGAGAFSGVGILADMGGKNTYTSNTAYAQGAGRESGDGVVLDRGTDATFTLGPGAAGQGSGVQGVGLILQTRGDALTRYVASEGSLPSLTLGGGLGARVNRGDFALLGAFPDLQCPREAIEVIGFENATVYNTRLLTLRLCTPDESSKEALRNPTTGEPVGDVPRPAVPCREIDPCEDVVSGQLGEGPVDWLESPRTTTTFSGGLTWISGTNGLMSRYMAPSADDLCKLSCAGFNAVDALG